MRIAVIGATGHIGSWLVPRLVAAGHDVVGVTRGRRPPYRDMPEWNSVSRVELDRTSAETAGTFGHSIAALRADVVVDLICFDSASACHLVEALRGKVSHFLHCGTLWVHGIPKSRPYDETAPREPFGDYGIRKADIERMLLAEATRGFPVSILHPGHITGPGWAPVNPAGNLDPSVFENLAAGKRIVLPDDGGATLQHVHADDVAQAFELAIAHRDSAIGQSFHVAAREPVTMLDFARAAASWFRRREAVIDFVPLDDVGSEYSERDAALTRDHAIHSPFASIAKAESVLGFAPAFTAVEAARDAVLAPRHSQKSALLAIRP